jgi:hypothetical protein
MKPDENAALEYAKKQIELGWSEEQIKQGLIHQGWEGVQAELILTKIKLGQEVKKSIIKAKIFKKMSLKFFYFLWNFFAFNVSGLPVLSQVTNNSPSMAGRLFAELFGSYQTCIPRPIPPIPLPPNPKPIPNSLFSKPLALSQACHSVRSFSRSACIS